MPHKNWQLGAKYLCKVTGHNSAVGHQAACSGPQLPSLEAEATQRNHVASGCPIGDAETSSQTLWS